MLAVSNQYKSNIIDLTIPDEPRPGDHIAYTRNGRILSGVVWGTITTQVQRHLIDGKHPVVVEYVVEVDAGFTNLRYHTIHESDVVWNRIHA